MPALGRLAAAFPIAGDYRARQQWQDYRQGVHRRDFAAAVWRAVLATQGNQNNALGVPLSLFRLSSQYRAAVLELGASGHGEIALLGEMPLPDIAIITNTGLDHLAGFGGCEGAAHANGEVFSAMGREAIAETHHN